MADTTSRQEAGAPGGPRSQAEGEDVREPDRPQLLGQWVSGDTGTHRNFYNGGQWVYATSNLPAILASVPSGIN